MKKRLFAVLLTVAMCLSLLPVSVLAAYGDVPENEWYTDAVDYVTEQGMMNGVGDENFDPEGTLNRAMLVTILWRMEGSPAAGPNTFTDVPNGEWYTQAIAWASANGIVEGYGNGLFGPTDEITREQLATIMYRYADMKGENMETDKDLADFPDGNTVSTWAQDAMVWAVARGLISGDDNGNLDAQGDATRAQTAMILYRFDTTPEVTPPEEEPEEKPSRPSGGGGGGGHSHSWSAWTVKTAATCTTAGEEIRTCSSCGAEETQVIDALGHTETVVITKTATCTEDGSQRSKCSVCNEWLKEETKIDAIGHSYPDIWTITVPATCTAAGTKIKTCEHGCGEKQTETIPAAHGELVAIPAVDAKCPATTGLSAGERCTICGTITKAQTVTPATGSEHSWLAGEKVTGEGCAVYTPYSCACGATKTVDEGTEHTEGAWVHVESENKHTKSCTVCSAVLETKPCAFGTWTVDNQEEGKHTRSCDVTGTSHSESEAHSYDARVSVDETKTPAEGTLKCSACDGTTTETYAAKVDSTYYTTLDAAITAAGTDKIVVLLADVTTETAITSAVKLNINGKTANLSYADKANIQIVDGDIEKLTVTLNGKTVVFGSAVGGMRPVAAAYQKNNETSYQSVDIYTADGMVWFGKTDIKGQDEAHHCTVTLMDNIDMTGKVWVTKDVTDIDLNGNNKTISNLVCEQETGHGRGGLFGQALHCKIYDLTLENLTATGAQAATIIGNTQGNGNINGITLKGSIDLIWKQNTGNYKEVSSGVGVITGVEQNGDQISNITIDTGCVVTLNMVGMTTSLTGWDYIAGHTAGEGTHSATNNGTVIIQRDGFTETITKDGTIYEISNANGLKYFRDTVNGGDTYAGKTVKLMADINLNNEAWTPISSFAGTFDGNNKTISNLKDAALFGTVSGEVKNLNLQSVTRTTDQYNGAGAVFIGTVAADAVVNNCKVSDVTLTWANTVANSRGDIDCGDGISGVVGSVNPGGTVQNCEFTNINITTDGKTKRAGGVFGGISGTVKNCTVDGVDFTVTDNYSGYAYFTEYAGGFAASVNGGAAVEDCTIKNVTVTADRAFTFGGVFGKAFLSNQIGDITLKNINVEGLKLTIGNTVTTGNTYKNIGGFIGQVDKRANEPRLKMENCHITGLDMAVAGTNSEDCTAGFISSLNGGADITNCSVAGEIDGTNESLGIGGFLGEIGGYSAPTTGYTINITGCSADVAITGNDNIFVGGFVSYAGSQSYNITLTLNFTNCEATGSFYGEKDTNEAEVSTFTGSKVDGAAFNG